MTVALGPAKRRLAIQAAVGLACVAIVLAALWMVAGLAGSHRSATSGYRLVQATVKVTASCQGTDQEDSITFTLDGQAHQAKLSACGHRVGDVVGVLVPASYGSDTAMVQSDTAPGDSAGASRRVAFILLIAATAIGGACGYRFFRTRTVTIAPRPARPGSGGDRRFNGDEPQARRSPFGRFARSRSDADPDEPEPDEDYHTGYQVRVRNHDPEATGVDWFEDSSAHMFPVPPPADLGHRTDKS